ncbi:MAG: hypothetical protein M3Z46_04595 [Actinomycetota bacterium]|nr:hypothetical protein [Actinomycetota bacterium]
MPAVDRHDLRSLVRTYWPLAVIGATAMLVAIVAHHLLFPAYSWNRDEPVYIWQVHTLRTGHIRVTDGGAPRLFRPWLTGAQDGVVFSHFTVGWPLVLVAGDVIFGSPEAGLAFASLLAVLGTYALARELTRDHVLALVAAGVMVASPILALQGGIYLGYIFTLGLGLLFAAALISGVRRARPRRIALAGAVLGWILLTRPFDAVLWGVAVSAYVVVVHRRDRRALRRATAWFAAGALPLVVLTLVFNRLATGTFTQFPNTASDPLDKFGFGFRRIMPGFGQNYYGGSAAVIGSLRNAAWTPLFLAGNYLGVVAAAFGLWLRRREQSTIALLVLGAVFPFGYFFFWGTSVSALTARLSGPIYFVPLYAPLSILVATTILFVWRRRRAFGIAAIAVLVIATIPVAANRFAVNRKLSEVQLPWKRATRSIDRKALVFVAGTNGYLLYLNPYSANRPDLTGKVLYASDRGSANLDLIAARRDRTPYLQRTSQPPDDLGPKTHPDTPKIVLTPMRILRGKGVTLRVHITNPVRTQTVGAYIKVGHIVRWRILATNAKAGATFDTEWRVGVPDPAGSADPSIVALTRRLGTVSVGVGYGPDADFARNHPKYKQIFAYRIHASSIEMLLPQVQARARPKKKRSDKRDWAMVDHLANLDVRVGTVTGTSRRS